MTPEQVGKLLSLLEVIAGRIGQYTITGAADWPILAAIGAILLAVIGVMWADLRTTIRDGKGEWKESLSSHKADNEKEHDDLWTAFHQCQAQCCPYRRHSDAKHE